MRVVPKNPAISANNILLREDYSFDLSYTFITAIMGRPVRPRPKPPVVKPAKPSRK